MQLSNTLPSKTEMDASTLSVPSILNNELNNNYNSTYSFGNDIFLSPLSPSVSRLSVSICPLYEHEESISNQSRRQPHITSITSDRTDENLIMIDDYDQHSMSDSMSDDTETHALSYTPQTVRYHDVLSPVSESESEEYVTTLFGNNNLKCKRKNLSDIIVNHSKGQVHGQIQERCTRQSVEIDSKLTQIINSMSSMQSNPEIMRLQEQLSNLSEKIKSTQELTRQMQLLHHSPLLSNRTHRIVGSNSHQSHISISSRASDISNNESVNVPSGDNDNIAKLIDVPSTPAFYGYNSYNQLQTPPNQPLIANFTPHTPSNQTITPMLPFIEKGKNEIAFPDVDVLKKAKNNEKQKCKKKNSKKVSCDSVAEIKLLKKKKKNKKKQKKMCIWPSFQCFDLRVCMKNRKVNV